MSDLRWPGRPSIVVCTVDVLNRVRASIPGWHDRRLQVYDVLRGRIVPQPVRMRAGLVLDKEMQRKVDRIQHKWVVPAETAHPRVPESEISSLFFAHTGYQAHKWAHYLPAYDEQFSPFRSGFPQRDGSFRPLRMLEIGVRFGGSLQIWRQYFGPDASIWGIDIDNRCSDLQGDFTVRIGSQADAKFLRTVVEEMGGVDIVLDDGSHVTQHQRASFRTLFPLLSDGGVYAVEDLHTSYWPEFSGGYHRRCSFVEMMKDLIDDMHASYHNRGESLGISATQKVPRLTFYDSIVFIAKAERPTPMSVRVGTATF